GKIFVSHTHEDNAACRPLLAALDAWEVDYWFDLTELSAGLEFFDHIQRALGERDVFLRVCTPAALSSYWMGEEQKLARGLLASSRTGHRLIINLILKPGYITSPAEAHDVTIDATTLPQLEWLRRLRETLGIPSRERRLSRRTVLGLGVTSVAALGAMGYTGVLFLNRPNTSSFNPVIHQPTATPQLGASRIRWTYTLASAPFRSPGEPTSVSVAGDVLVCNCLSSAELTALSRADGALRWTSATYGSLNTNAPPTVSGETVYITSGDVRSDPTAPDSFLDDVLLVALKLS